MGRPVDHALPPELLEVVIAGGWAYEAELPRWRESMLETVHDLSLTPAEVALVFRRYEQTQSSLRPRKSELWFTRGKRWQMGRDFIDRALGRGVGTTLEKLRAARDADPFRSGMHGSAS